MKSNSTDPREIRRFGIVVLFFFGSLCALGIWKQKPVPATLFGVLGCLGACFVLFPSPARPLHTGWLKVAHLMGRIVTTAMLTLAYFLVITPAAWLKRLFGGRPLPVKPDRETASYWVERSEPAQPRERFLKRF
jgi:hypothetical protein